jgi:hypothetical protein
MGVCRGKTEQLLELKQQMKVTYNINPVISRWSTEGSIAGGRSLLQNDGFLSIGTPFFTRLLFRELQMA